MIIDFHCHVGKDISGNEMLSFDELKSEMDRWDVDKAVVFPFNSKDLIGDSLKILEESKSKGWIIPFLRFNPNLIEEKVLKSLLEKNFMGIKLHPTSQKFRPDNPKFFWIYEICEKEGIPILFHSSTASLSYAHPKFILNLSNQFPHLKIIMAHFFASGFKLMEEFAKHENLYVDLSISSGTLKRKQAIEKYGMENLIFASDIPYDSMGVSLLKIKEVGFGKDDLDKIMYKNALKVLRKFPRKP